MSRYSYPPREIIDPEEVKRSMVESQVRRSNAAIAEYDEREKRRANLLASLPKETPAQVNKTPILKSALLKNEENMNALGKGSFSSLSLGLKCFEVLKAQEALKEVGAYQGKVDGSFGGLTDQSVKAFQKEYSPSHVFHKQYSLGGVDGIVGKNTVLALDEAVGEGWKIPILKSSTLKESKHLNQLADGKFNALKSGSRDKSEIEKIQEALIELGFDLGKSGADGDFGSRTEKAVRQFQDVYDPTYITHESYKFGDVDGIVGKNTILALDEAVNENWEYIDDEMDEKWLTVHKGQLTFYNEGNDIVGSIYFTRVPHVPNTKGIVIGESGITFGRGLDLGSRNQGDVEQIFSNVSINCKPISNSLLEWLKKGAGLKGQKAYDHYKNIADQVPKLEQELTRKQQHFLFLEIYPSYEKETERLLTKSDVRSSYDQESVIAWSELSRNIREVLVDITYRGDNRSSSRKMIVPSLVTDINDELSGSESKFYLLMKDHKVWIDKFKVDNNRYEARYKALIK